MANVDTCIIYTTFWMNDDYFSEEQSQIVIGRLFLLLASNRKIQAFNSCQSGMHLEPIQKTHFWPAKQNV